MSGSERELLTLERAVRRGRARIDSPRQPKRILHPQCRIHLARRPRPVQRVEVNARDVVVEEVSGLLRGPVDADAADGLVAAAGSVEHAHERGGEAGAIVAAQIATYLPFPAMSVAGELALVAMGEQSGEAAAMAVAVGLIPGGKLMGKLSKFMSGASSAAWRATKDIISKKGAAAAKWFLSGGIYGQMFRTARGMLSKCGCFTPETRVWTATGPVAIASIQPGDMVFALDEATGQTSLRMVTEVFEREGDAPLVIVHVSSGETIETTEEHPFLVSGRWVRADRLSRGDELDGAFGCVSVVAVEHTSRLSRVHNLEVEGLHNYRVGPDGVVVHNSICKVIREWYESQVRRIPQNAMAKGGATLEDAKWAHAERNRLRDAARNRMRQNGLAEQADDLDRTDPNRTWDWINNKYGGDPKQIIEAAGRPRKYDLGG